MNLYGALLRGINVGGGNLIRMAALKTCFEAEGFGNVATYIQSGNVVFAARRGDPRALTLKIERALTKTFAYDARVVLRSLAQMQATVANAPRGFGRRPQTYRYDAIFLKEPVTAEEAMRWVSVKPGVDRAVPGAGVLYFSRLIARATSSQLGRIVGTPVYRDMTIRNWNTTTRLLAIMEQIETSGTLVGSDRRRFTS